MSWLDQDDIFDKLDALGEYETVSSFAYAYYGLIADYLAGDGRTAQELRQRLVDFLQIVERYHRALGIFESADEVTLGNVRSAAEKRDIGLSVLLEQLNAVSARGDSEVGRLLLSAECYYQLTLVERVVDRLEKAVESGADDPLVQFALGYNRYELATRAFTRYDSISGRRQVDDDDRYRLACLSAVSALQRGLCGDQFDAQLHWWIGNILRTAGFEEASEASFEKAQQLLTEIEQTTAADLISLEIDAEAIFDYDVDLGAGGGPISEDEVRRAALLLRRSYSESDLFND